MNEISDDYLIRPYVPDAQREALNRGTLVWMDKETSIWYPENPLVPKEEGLHIRVETFCPVHPKTREDWKLWLRHWAKVFGAGKVLSEGAALPDMWQSFVGQSEYTSSNILVTDIIGRNPTGESWGKTAPFPPPDYDNRQRRLPNEQVQKYAETLSRFFNRFWKDEIPKVELFPEEEKVENPRISARFHIRYAQNKALDWPWMSELLFMSKSVEIVAILVPHLKTGMHLMIGGKGAPSRPWRNLNHSLQMMACAEAAAQVLEETDYQGTPLAAWESIRATGSWFGGFMKLLENPEFRILFMENQDADFTEKLKLLLAEKNGDKRLASFAKLFDDPKFLEHAQISVVHWMKRAFQGKHPDFFEFPEWTMGIGFHPHLYAAREHEDIRLTQRPADEEGLDWKGIWVMKPDKREAIKNTLNADLMRYLRKAEGKIV